LAGLTQLHEADWWQESRGAALLSGVLNELKPVLPQELGKHLPA
jgi:membrane protein required for colicin V production